MWTPIFKQNKENVIETLEEYINNLQQFKELMQQDNFTEIFKEMEKYKLYKTNFKRYKIKAKIK